MKKYGRAPGLYPLLPEVLYEDNTNVFRNFYQWFFNNLAFNNFTLDLDSSVVTRYGEQQGAAVGYNVKKPGRSSHHPLMAFVADVEMVANFWLRSGDAHTSNNFEAFLLQTFITSSE